jgi:hypothetical protein
MVYWFSDFPNETARFTYTSAQYKRDWDLLVKLADEIATASSYPLTDDRTKCRYCPYRSYCDRGVRAGDVDQAEAEMEAEELFDVNFEQIREIAFSLSLRARRAKQSFLVLEIASSALRLRSSTSLRFAQTPLSVKITDYETPNDLPRHRGGM